MECQKTLFTEVQPFYEDLIDKLKDAKEKISMMYYAFDNGDFSQEISKVLVAKAQSGVQTRLMVDELGQVLDEPRHAFQNKRLIFDLQKNGVQTEIFKPKGAKLSNLNRLHCKVCAIDDRVVFLGGSNIAEHYLSWNDLNLRMDGSFGNDFHNVFDQIHQFSNGKGLQEKRDPKMNQQLTRDYKILLTLPKIHQDIRQELLKLIQGANKSIYIRTWYFLPDNEILNALLSKARNGLRVHILLSHKTRVRPIDYANFIPCHKLSQSGVRIIRYTPRYMHAKVAWNNHSDIIFGSANLENMALYNTFECCVAVRDSILAQRLTESFEMDAKHCLQQTEEIFHNRSWIDKTLSYSCNLASPWL